MQEHCSRNLSHLQRSWNPAKYSVRICTIPGRLKIKNPQFKVLRGSAFSFESFRTLATLQRSRGEGRWMWGESNPINCSLSSHSEVLSLQPESFWVHPQKVLGEVNNSFGSGGISQTMKRESKEGRRTLRPEVKGWGWGCHMGSLTSRSSPCGVFTYVHTCRRISLSATVPSFPSPSLDLAYKGEGQKL